MKAFPQTANYTEEFGGMNLRDYFAAHAPEMPTFFERKTWFVPVIREEAIDGNKFCYPATESRQESHMQHYIRWRYAYADEMMKAREKE